MEDDLNGEKKYQWMITLMEEDLRKMTLACLVSQFCTELGPAQPQLVYVYVYLM